jgi:uncharacterized protein
MGASDFRPRVAVIGGGISGLGAAWHLARHAEVTLFEAGQHFGGHANTVDVTLDGHTHGVDTGFLVYNERTYPQLIALFEELAVPVARSDMSFSVQVRSQGLEWSGSSLATVFAQKRNLMRPAFLSMLADLMRFNRLATALAESGSEAALQEDIGSFLERHRFGTPFRQWYFLPMIGCIWSCPMEQMLRFPISTMVRFCHNHGLLQVSKRPAWFTVKGGSREYVRRMLVRIREHGHTRLATPVEWVRRLPAGERGVLVHSRHGTERYDDVVLASHSDQSLALLADASADERRVLGAVRYQPNRAVLHTDTAVLPQRRAAWAAWNYEHLGGSSEQGHVCLHYLISRLQPLPFTTPVVVSLNPGSGGREPRAAQVLAEINYSHPVFDRAAVHAQAELPALQGQQHTWFAGAWTRYGFHEDGLMSGRAVADALLQRFSSQAALPQAA